MKQIQMNQGGAPILPLLVGCTKPQPIETLEHDGCIMYDPIAQIIPMDMRVVGTYSLRTRGTSYQMNKLQKGVKADRKNEIDDQKNVK